MSKKPRFTKIFVSLSLIAAAVVTSQALFTNALASETRVLCQSTATDNSIPLEIGIARSASGILTLSTTDPVIDSGTLLTSDDQGATTIYTFSNECDNMITLKLPKDALSTFQKRSFSGEMSYQINDKAQTRGQYEVQCAVEVSR
ncbi:hypothetical protein WDW86_05525 [Bdellovibrionota bacterium FG-2]